MKASFQWLRALVPQIPDDPHAVAERLTGAGVEVEGMHAYGEGIEPCEVVAVESVRPHPSKSGLRLVTVSRGPKGAQEVVCGAPNVPGPGGLVVLAPLGTHLPAKGMTIERRTIAGVTSEGMLCSESELGLTDESEGILLLPPGLAEPGTRFVEVVPQARDTIFEVGLTPNRPDGLGHLGLARELATLFGVTWSPPAPEEAPRRVKGKASDQVTVTIEDDERCPHYGAMAVVDGTPGPSPLGLRYRLSALGVRPISNVVDVTNLVMLEYGHPMHAFDLDRVRGRRIVVRRARKGETLKTLDGVQRTLDEDDLVICDGDGPVALAGVMGGGESEIGPGTRRVLLECATFDARSVRRSARRHGLHTESSHRFERGVDHGDTADALAQAASMVARLSGGAVVEGMTMVVARPLHPLTVRLRLGRMGQLLGFDVPPAHARAILERLGFEVRETGGDVLECLVPTHRPDVTREVDVIDEVARIHGLDHVPTVLPAIRATGDVGDQETLTRRARWAAVANGLAEAVTLGFAAADKLAAVGAPSASVVLQNPLAEHHAVLRTSLLPGLLDAVARARRHGERDVGIFTVGRVFLAHGPGAPSSDWPVDEPLRLAAVLAGERHPWLQKGAAVDVWDAKGVGVGIVERLGRAVVARALSDGERPKHLHPRGAGALVVDGALVGTFGILHPDVAAAFDLGKDTVVIEIDLAAFAALPSRPPRFVPLPRFPAAVRDLAVVVHDDVAAGAVEAAVREAGGALAERVEIFDRFVGGAVPEHHASLAFRVVYRAPDRTLTDADVDAQHGKVVAEVGKRFGATLRQ